MFLQAVIEEWQDLFAQVIGDNFFSKRAGVLARFFVF